MIHRILKSCLTVLENLPKNVIVNSQIFFPNSQSFLQNIEKKIEIMVWCWKKLNLRKLGAVFAVCVRLKKNCWEYKLKKI